MLHSMTGFARQTAESALGTLTCELRAVNHRYLDVQLRLPDELRPKETELRQRIGRSLSRGKVECSLHLRRDASERGEIRLNEDLVRQLAARAEELSALLPATAALNPLDVLRWPGVIEDPVPDAESLYAETQALLDAALQSLGEMRRNEGARIGTMLETRCAEILSIAGSVRKRMPEVLQAVRNRQRERIDKLDVAADPARLETELALIAQKLDVDEELDRLESHISEIRDTLCCGEPVGRRLDFLMQELNREANTLGSKSADTATTRAAVELKVLIEQMREQIQNVE
ncbi:MAG: YicC family protein [Gammaproteobacteria bacterium]|nr:MAG: YicC family protein [Gammaproteobacteria bacterium]